MLKHIVMWKLKDFAEGAPKAENARKAKLLLEGLKKEIPEVKTLEIGVNISDCENAYDMALYAEFENAADLTKYQEHPEHQKAGEFIGRVRLERRVVDYEV